MKQAKLSDYFNKVIDRERRSLTDDFFEHYFSGNYGEELNSSKNN